MQCDAGVRAAEEKDRGALQRPRKERLLACATADTYAYAYAYALGTQNAVGIGNGCRRRGLRAGGAGSGGMTAGIRDQREQSAYKSVDL